MPDTTYTCCDLKSYYASEECVQRGLAPLKAYLVVADESRTDKTICLAVSPALKAVGIPGRARLFEVKQRIQEVNRERQRRAPGGALKGGAVFASALDEDPSLALDLIIAPPRMKYYMEYSRKIVEIYLRHVSAEDLLVYSVDEVFIDATHYLSTYHMTAHELAMTMIRDVLRETRITATAGIGTNLYLAKVAMDIVAKHVPPDENGVRMAELDEMRYRRVLWGHRPLTDFWRVGPGTARKLEQNGMFTMGDVARMSMRREPIMGFLERPRKNESRTPAFATGEDLLYRLFGVNAELLIDHAWGWEPTTVAQTKQYSPQNRSVGSGQVLHRPYSFEQARVIVTEMADDLSLELVRRGLTTDQIALSVGYDQTSVIQKGNSFCYPDGRPYSGEVVSDSFGRMHPKHAGGGVTLGGYTASTRRLVEAAQTIYDAQVDPDLLIRRVNVGAISVLPEEEARRKEREAGAERQLDMFTDYARLDAEREAREREMAREKRLQQAAVAIKAKFGKNALLKGTNFVEGARGRERNAEVGGHRAGPDDEVG